MLKRKVSALTLALGMLLLPISASAAGTQTDSAAAEITIYHTNDTHGYLTGDGESIVGLSTASGLKAASPDAILVDAGDALQGLPIASLTKGNDVVELMNLAGYDLMVPGNHEFDFGTEAFLTNVELADFPILSANIYQDGHLLLEGLQENNPGCHTIIERNGIQVGFFGITTTQTASATNPAGIQDLTFTDEIQAARQEIDHLEEAGADVVIAVVHLGDETAQAPCTSADLANAMTGEYEGALDIIIDGHSHTVENEEVNGVLIVQTGSGMSAIGELTVSVLPDGSVRAEERLLGAADLADVTPSPQVEAKLEDITASQAELLNEVIGETPTTLWAGWIGNVPPTRFVETNYGNLAADAFADAGRSMIAGIGTEEEKAMPVVAVENGGGIRESIANGDITLGGLTTTFPFSNTLYIKKITPAILYQVMEQSASSLDGQDTETGMLLQTSVSGGFLQISGFRVVYNPDQEAGNKVVSITLDGQDAPLDRTDETTGIFLVGNNYIMSGGNDYTMLAGIEKYAEAGGELETIEAYTQACLEDGILTGYAGTEGRISYTGSGYIPKDYTVSIQITGEDGTAYANQEISYRVDGKEGQTGTTDENGILSITVSDGGHGIRVSDSGEEVYVDNYSGIGIVDDDLRDIPVLTAPAAGEEIPVTAGSQTEDTTAAEESEAAQEPQEDSLDDVPQTGETGHTQLYLLAAFMFAGALVMLGRKSENRR